MFLRPRAQALLLAAGLGVPMLVAAPTAQALDSPVGFTSAPLSTYQTNGVVRAVVSNGSSVFIGGKFTKLRPPGAAAGTSEITRTNVAVLDAATGAPKSCAPAVTHTTSPSSAIVRTLELSPDKKTLYVGGFFNRVAGAARTHLAAIDVASCTTVSTFRPAPNSHVLALEATSSKVFYGGTFTSVGGTARARAAAAGAVGSGSPGSLLSWAPRFDGQVRALATKPDGTAVVVAGAFTTVNGTGSRAVAVVNSGSGATVRAYGGSFVSTHSAGQEIAVDSTGFYTGHEGTGFGEFDGRIAFDWSTLNQRWRDTCLGATQALVVDNGVLYSGSHAHDCASMSEFPDGFRHHLLAQRVSDPDLLPWFPNTNGGISEAVGPRDMAVARTGSGDVLWVVGEFTRVEGVAQQGLTRFGRTRHTSGPSTPAVAVASNKAGVVRVTWRQSLDTDDAQLTYRVYRDGGTTPVHTVQDDDLFWERHQKTFVDTSLAPGSTHSYVVEVTDGRNTRRSGSRSIRVATADSRYANRVLADAPTAYWRYDDPSGVFRSDATSKDNGGTLYGSATVGRAGAIGGDPSKALELPGTNGTIYSERRFPVLTRYSLETWFKTSTTRGGKLMGIGYSQFFPSKAFDRHVYMTDAGTLRFGVRTGGNNVTIASSRAYNDGAWHHVVATQGDSGMALYVDGQRVASNSVTGALSFSGWLRVGGDRLDGWPSKPTSAHFAGVLDETALYERALPASTVSAHYGLR